MNMKALCFLLLAVISIAAWAAEPASTNAVPPSFANVKYGEHARNVLDIWLAKSNQPTPLVVFIHGGGWRGGSKSDVPPELVKFWLAHGISVASINYRLSQMATLPAPVHDAARAVQFIRFKARDWNLRKDRIAAMGGSAGACTTLWLAYHDDLAAPQSADPVARESTRLCAGVDLEGQTSIDPEVVVAWVGDQILNHGMFWAAVGATNRAEAKLRYSEFQPLFHEFSPINHVSAGDPPVLLVYLPPTPLPAPDPGTAIHHAMLGQKLKEAADRAGLDCTLIYEDKYDENSEAVHHFLLEHLLKP
jgi:arylformamidase